MLPHEFLCAVAQGRELDGHKPTFPERLEAAKAAAPFYAPKLANIEHQGESVRSYIISPDPLSIEDWEKKYCQPRTPGTERPH